MYFLGLYNTTSEWLGVLILIFIFIILMYIFFLMSLSNTLKAIHPSNREMEPSSVYLLFIPIFNYIWIFIVVNAISNSIEKELRSRGMLTSSKPTYANGLAYAILSVAFVLFNYILPTPQFLLVAIISFVICFISYWSSVVSYKNKIESAGYNANNFNQYSSTQPNIPITNQGYQGGYSGGHNNHGTGNNYNVNQNQNYQNSYPNNTSSEYKSGDLYK